MRTVVIPGQPGTCVQCGDPVVWARTASTERGRGGKAIMLNPEPDPVGRFAVSAPRRGVAVARPLAADDTADRVTEVRATAHAATCQPAMVTVEAPDNVLPIRVDRGGRTRAGWCPP